MPGPASQTPTAEFNAFFEAVYEELLRIARAKGLTRITPSLDSIALISETYLKLRASAKTKWNEAEHVKAVASIAMVQVLRTYLAKKVTKKRGGRVVPLSLQRDPLGEDLAPGPNMEDELLRHLDALAALETVSPRRAHIEMMRFCGYEIPEIAQALGLSTATVKRNRAHVEKVLRAYFASDDAKSAAA